MRGIYLSGAGWSSEKGLIDQVSTGEDFYEMPGMAWSFSKKVSMCMYNVHGELNISVP